MVHLTSLGIMLLGMKPSSRNIENPRIPSALEGVFTTLI